MRTCIFVLILALFPFWVSGKQTERTNSTFDPDKLIFGGDFGFGISNNFWTVGVSPQIGYKLTNRLHVGGGIGYRYAKSDEKYHVFVNENNKWEPRTYRYTENSVSFNLFVHYYPWRNLIFSAKPEIMHTWYRGTFGNYKYSENKFVPAVIVGGGLHLKPVILQLNYELIQDKYSPYSNNIFFSVGCMF